MRVSVAWIFCQEYILALTDSVCVSAGMAAEGAEMETGDGGVAEGGAAVTRGEPRTAGSPTELPL